MYITGALMTKRSSVFGVGINNADYAIKNRKSGFVCPYYSRWAHMIKRCYSKRFHECSPTYKDCTVCDEWLLFSAFKEWMEKQDWIGKCLDKDIIKPGNKLYSPSTCRFVDQSLNSLLCDGRKIRGKHKKGVCFNKANNNFLAYITIKNKRVNLGSYNTEELAYNTYKKAKKTEILRQSLTVNDLSIRNGLILHAELL